MKTTMLLGLMVLALAAFSTGCKTGQTGAAYTPVDTNKRAVENSAKFVLLDAKTQTQVTCSGLQEQVLADGRLEVMANVRNRVNKRIVVQINCVFKDAQGFPVDETPFQTLVLTERAQEGVRFVCINDQAKGYTIRVRQTR